MKKLLIASILVMMSSAAWGWTDPFWQKVYDDTTTPKTIDVHMAGGEFTIGTSTADYSMRISSTQITLPDATVITSTSVFDYNTKLDQVTIDTTTNASNTSTNTSDVAALKISTGTIQADYVSTTTYNADFAGKTYDAFVSTAGDTMSGLLSAPTFYATTGFRCPDGTIITSTSTLGGGGGASAFNDLTDVSVGSPTAGDILYYNGSYWVVLSSGTSGQYLQTGTTPQWASPSGSGDMLKATYDTDSDNIVDNSEELGGHTSSYYQVDFNTTTINADKLDAHEGSYYAIKSAVSDSTSTLKTEVDGKQAELSTTTWKAYNSGLLNGHNYDYFMNNSGGSEWNCSTIPLTHVSNIVFERDNPDYGVAIELGKGRSGSAAYSIVATQGLGYPALIIDTNDIAIAEITMTTPPQATKRWTWSKTDFNLTSNYAATLSTITATAKFVCPDGTVITSTSTLGGGSYSGTANEIDVSGNVIGIADDPSMPGSGAMIVTLGSTGSRPAGTLGMLRYNSTLNNFEGYDTDWRSFLMSNDIAANSNLLDNYDSGYFLSTTTSGGYNVIVSTEIDTEAELEAIANVDWATTANVATATSTCLSKSSATATYVQKAGDEISGDLNVLGDIKDSGNRISSYIDFGISISSASDAYLENEYPVIHSFSYAVTIQTMTITTDNGTIDGQVAWRVFASSGTGAGTNVWSSAVSANSTSISGGTWADNTIPENSELIFRGSNASGCNGLRIRGYAIAD